MTTLKEAWRSASLLGSDDHQMVKRSPLVGIALVLGKVSPQRRLPFSSSSARPSNQMKLTQEFVGPRGMSMETGVTRNPYVSFNVLKLRPARHPRSSSFSCSGDLSRKEMDCASVRARYRSADLDDEQWSSR